MKSITLSEERINEILPANVKNSNVISENAKRVLAVLLNHYMASQKALDAGFLAIDNVTLRKSCQINMNKTLAAVQELTELKLIVRVRGKKRSDGSPSVASCYYFNIENITTNPIVRPTPEELLRSLVMPIGITNTNSDINIDINSNNNFNSTVNIDSPIDINSSIDINDHSDNIIKYNVVKTNKENILYNKKNIIDYTVEETEPTEHCEGDSKTTEETNKQQTYTTMTETNNTNDQQNIIPAYAQTDLKLILHDLNNCSTIGELRYPFEAADSRIDMTDINGKLALLQLTKNVIEKNNINVESSELLEADGKMERLRGLFSGNENGLTLLRCITKIHPMTIQLLSALPSLTHRVVSEESVKAWYTSTANKC